MNVQMLTPQNLVRQAVIEVAQLPENELLVILETIASLKEQRARPNRERAAQIVARARTRALDTEQLPREVLFQQFNETLENIRAQAVAKGIAIEDEEQGG